jgi:hypothetical protein
MKWYWWLRRLFAHVGEMLFSILRGVPANGGQDLCLVGLGSLMVLGTLAKSSESLDLSGLNQLHFHRRDSQMIPWTSWGADKMLVTFRRVGCARSARLAYSMLALRWLVLVCHTRSEELVGRTFVGLRHFDHLNHISKL